jgi:hypothetical protein
MNIFILHSTELLENVKGVTTYDSLVEKHILIHTGGSMSFITGAHIIHKANCTSGDFHQVINYVNSEK